MIAQQATLEQLTFRVLQFLYEESAALDERRYDDWLGYLAEDFTYEVPLPLTPDDPAAEHYTRDTAFAWETKGSLALRFRRISDTWAWAERPSHFLRHIVSNVRVSQAGEMTLRSKSNVLVSRWRSGEQRIVATAGREDTLALTGTDQLRLQRRVVYLDVEVPTTSELMVVY
jgi:3-phenylpropionate/cinnamic acid dioxygenase small subunit